MKGISYVLVAALAICATQCRAAEIPASADRVDLRLFVENGAAIAKNMFNAVNAGLDQSKPYMDKILNELAPEARALIRKVIDETRARINEEDKRIAHIFNTLNKALDDLQPIKSCFDKVSPEAKKVALATERGIAKAVNDVQNKYKKEIENIKVGAEKILKKARTLFDTEIPAIVKCLPPGRKDAPDCLDKEIEKTLQGTLEIIKEIATLSQTAEDTLSPILPEILQKVVPLLEKTVKDVRVLLKKMAECVAGLK